MIPGLISKISERSIALASSFEATTDLIRVTDTTAGTTFATIVPKVGIGGQLLFLANQSGAAIASLTTGNVLTATTLASDRLTVLTYSKSAEKWIL